MYAIRHIKGMYWPKRKGHSLTMAPSMIWKCKTMQCAERKINLIKDEFFGTPNKEKKFNVEFLHPVNFMIVEL